MNLDLIIQTLSVKSAKIQHYAVIYVTDFLNLTNHKIHLDKYVYI